MSIETDTNTDPESSNPEEVTVEPILCPHCLRTKSNGIKCKGICVAESDY